MNEPILELMTAVVPFPVIVNGKRFNGNEYLLTRKCEQCKSHECEEKSMSKPETVLVCHKGMNYYGMEIQNNSIIVFGVNFSCGNAQNQPTTQKLHRWRSSTENILRQYKDIENKHLQSYFGAMHEVKTSVSLVNRALETYIMNSFPGATDMEKYSKISPELLTLDRSIKLLNDQLEMMSLVYNENSVEYGQKKKLSLYRIIDKYRKIFDVKSAITLNPITISGKSIINVKAFESLKNIFIVLIDNAIKYSLKGKSIDIEIHDTDKPIKGVHVKISSYGPTIPKDVEEKIYEKWYRYEYETLRKEGSGVGLYIAQLIAKAHKTQITYSSKVNEIANQSSYGFNIFQIFVPEE